MALNNDHNYKKLEDWYKAYAGSLNMRDMFDADLERFSKFRLEETVIRVRVDMRRMMVMVVVGRGTGGGRDAYRVHHFGHSPNSDVTTDLTPILPN